MYSYTIHKIINTKFLLKMITLRNVGKWKYNRYKLHEMNYENNNTKIQK